MPTYFPLSTKVQLVTADLAKSTTADLTQNKSTQARSNTEVAEQAIETGRALKENIIAPEDGGRVHFLGPNQDMPLLMVEAGSELFGNYQADSAFGSIGSSSRRRISDQHVQVPSSRQDSVEPRSCIPTRATSAARNDSIPSRVGGQNPLPAAVFGHVRRTIDHSTTEPTLAPQALIINVDLDDKSFVRSFDKNQRANDLAIDVFLNGEFCHSKLVTARKRLDEAKGGLTQTFSGTRVHRLVERAWVICPPSQNPDGSLRIPRKTKESKLSTEERWKQVAEALAAEADQRGFNKYGDRSPSGAYLASLAEMEMPGKVDKMQKRGGPKLGVVDVVITYGKGMKFGPETDYLMKPARFTDSQFTGGKLNLEGDGQTGKMMPSDNMSQMAIEESSSMWLAERLKSSMYLSEATAREARKGPPKFSHAPTSAQDESTQATASFASLGSENGLTGESPSNTTSRERTIVPQQRTDPSSTQSDLAGTPLTKRRLSQTLPTPAVESPAKRRWNMLGTLIIDESTQGKKTIEGPLGVFRPETLNHDIGSAPSPLCSRAESTIPVNDSKGTREVPFDAQRLGIPPMDQQMIDQNFKPPRPPLDCSRDRSPPPSSPVRPPVQLDAIQPPTRTLRSSLLPPHSFPSGLLPASSMFQSSPEPQAVDNTQSSELSSTTDNSPFTFEPNGSTSTPSGSSLTKRGSKRGRRNTRGGSRAGATNTGQRKLKRGVQDQIFTFSENILANHIPSPLSQDSVVTHAEPDCELGRGQIGGSTKIVNDGTKDTTGDGSAGVLRQIRSERAGKFDAEGVLLGVRFLIGGV